MVAKVTRSKSPLIFFSFFAKKLDDIFMYYYVLKNDKKKMLHKLKALVMHVYTYLFYITDGRFSLSRSKFNHLQ